MLLLLRRLLRAALSFDIGCFSEILLALFLQVSSLFTGPKGLSGDCEVFLPLFPKLLTG